MERDLVLLAMQQPSPKLNNAAGSSSGSSSSSSSSTNELRARYVTSGAVSDTV